MGSTRLEHTVSVEALDPAAYEVRTRAAGPSGALPLDATRSDC